MCLIRHEPNFIERKVDTAKGNGHDDIVLGDSSLGRLNIITTWRGDDSHSWLLQTFIREGNRATGRYNDRQERHNYTIEANRRASPQPKSDGYDIESKFWRNVHWWKGRNVRVENQDGTNAERGRRKQTGFATSYHWHCNAHFFVGQRGLLPHFNGRISTIIQDWGHPDNLRQHKPVTLIGPILQKLLYRDLNCRAQ